MIESDREVTVSEASKVEELLETATAEPSGAEPVSEASADSAGSAAVSAMKSSAGSAACPAGEGQHRSHGSSPCVTDRRFVRTRAHINEAFVELVEERGIDGFTVADIADRAGINRSTFYSHYKDKDDLLRTFEDEFLADLSDIEAKIANITTEELGLAFMDVQPLAVLVELFEYLGAHREALHALLGPNGDMRFERKLLDTVCNTLVYRVLDQKYSDNPTPLVNYYVSYFSNASLGVVRCWIEGGAKETPEEMASILMHLTFINPGDPIEIGGSVDTLK